MLFFVLAASGRDDDAHYRDPRVPTKFNGEAHRSDAQMAGAATVGGCDRYYGILQVLGAHHGRPRGRPDSQKAARPSRHSSHNEAPRFPAGLVDRGYPQRLHPVRSHVGVTKPVTHVLRSARETVSATIL